jgi:uncharacterized protein (DUF488 family)
MHPLGTNVVIYTVGHSTRTLEAFIHILKAHSIAQVADIRTIPRSSHNPQFNQETLIGELAEAKITYMHLRGLGGLRHPRPDSKNVGWHNASFRGFADYMQTEEFYESLMNLINLAKGERTAIMCAEALPWRCHRYLIADALLVRGVRAEHILSPIKIMRHVLTPWAVIEGTCLSYPLPQRVNRNFRSSSASN